MAIQRRHHEAELRVNGDHLPLPAQLQQQVALGASRHARLERRPNRMWDLLSIGAGGKAQAMHAGVPCSARGRRTSAISCWTLSAVPPLREASAPLSARLSAL